MLLISHPPAISSPSFLTERWVSPRVAMFPNVSKSCVSWDISLTFLLWTTSCDVPCGWTWVAILLEPSQRRSYLRNSLRLCIALCHPPVSVLQCHKRGSFHCSSDLSSVFVTCGCRLPGWHPPSEDIWRDKHAWLAVLGQNIKRSSSLTELFCWALNVGRDWDPSNETMKELAYKFISSCSKIQKKGQRKKD